MNTAHPLAATLAQIHRLDYVPGELDRTAPPRIWLQIDTGGSNDDRDEPWPGADHVTWQDEEIGGLEIAYVRADLAALPGGGVDVEKALRQAFALGQTYWAQADSESYSQNREAVGTLEKFHQLVRDTTAPTPNPHEADRNG